MAITLIWVLAFSWIFMLVSGFNQTALINDTYINRTTTKLLLSNTSNVNQKRNGLPHSKKTTIKKDEEGIPQAETPIRVVATSAVIKDRLSKPREPPKPVKAIHIWGKTPFKTVVNNLLKINNRIAQEQKRLFSPLQDGRPLQGFNNIGENAVILNQNPPEINLLSKQLTPKLDLQQSQLPPIIQQNEHYKEPPNIPLILNRPSYDQISPQLQPPEIGEADKRQQMFFARYGPQFNQAQLPRLLANTMHRRLRHHHKGAPKAKCSPNPCINDGVCTAFLNDYECTCPMGYMGKHCEDVNQCLPNPCKNNGNCYPTKNGFQCTCVRGFKGDNCESTSKCIPNPCKNGAICEEPLLVHEDYRCTCTPGYKGTNCQEADYCGLHNPCKSGGTCINGQSGYVCRCPRGYVGHNCADIDVCHSNPCSNGATCVSEGAGQFSCLCPYSFTGITCEEKKSRCSSFPCQNGGKCIDENHHSFRCECADGFTGTLCQNIRSQCESDPCVNNGKCIDNGNSFSCVCQPRYSGTTCEVYLGSGCSGCHSNAQCIFGKCVCISGFIGNGFHCTDAREEAVSKCHPNPCYNGGTCVEDDDSGFVCECPKGYRGPTCKVFLACLSQPCHNEGTCIDGQDDGTYTCKCKPGYKGVNCEEPTVCEPNPCENGGICLPDGDTYFCKCPQRFQGRRCQEDKCSLCDVHAHCEEGKCICDEGYSGEGTKGQCFKRGASNPRFCEPNPCLNGGTCEELPNGRKCECPTGFDGESCELPIGHRGQSPPREEEKPDPCSSRPCQNGGTCIRQGNGFQCECPQDFAGSTCELPVANRNPIPVCHPSPCLHGGTCQETDNGGYTCKCDGAYRGQNCEVDDCDQCDLHAICVKGACRCRIGYKGDGFQCEKIKQCNQCSKYASCVNNVCTCNHGYTGNGQQCQVTNKCDHCPPHSHCILGSCVCGNGYYFDGKHCVAPPSVVSTCPAGCATTCAPTCPHHCCRVSIMPAVCPRYCTSSQCLPSCPASCCSQSTSCPSYCSPTQCLPICPVQCCSACPPSCNSNQCTADCPTKCCQPSSPTQTALSSSQACPDNCDLDCTISCPKHCCITLNDQGTENAVSRTIDHNHHHANNTEEPSERRDKLLSILLSPSRDVCPEECDTESCSYLCPAQCCGETAEKMKHLKRTKIPKKP